MEFKQSAFFLNRWFKGPPAFRLSPTQRSTSLFVDFLPFGISRMWVHGLFSGAGKVVDVYISKKRRKNNNLAFGFVRFQRREDAMAAIKLFHGWRIKYWDIKVSLARYSRDGSPFVLRNRIEQRFRVISPYKRGFKEPCVRGFKSSAEVLNGPRRTGATNTVAILAKRSDKVADIREIAKQPSVFLESSQVLESINNKPESESVAVVPLDDDVEMSLSNGDKNAKEKLGVEEKLPHPHGHDVESPPAPLAVGRQSAPKPSTVAGPDRILEQPKRSDNTQNISIKKAKGKRGFLNSKGIADYLGFYTSGPSPAVSSSHILT